MNFLTSRDSSDGEASESEDSSGAEPSVETEEASEITMSCGSTVIGRDERAVFLKKQSKSLSLVICVLGISVHLHRNDGNLCLDIVA
jgi:hypothetical protein